MEQKTGSKPEKPKKPEPKKVEPVVKKAEPKKPLFTEVKWKGIKKVYRCEKCGWNEDTKDQMILHVLEHFPVPEREKILERLVK